MMFNVVVLIVAGVVTYMWVIRGFFSALIHLVCTVIAGAVAFGVWEPLSYWMLESAPNSGIGSHLTGMAWGLGLLLPFGITLGILRLIIDQLLPANVVLATKLNYTGGAVCGLISGVLTAGVVAIGLSYFRTSPEFGKPYAFKNGAWVRDAAMWVPVDKVTAGFFGTLSQTAFRTPEPLAKWHPDLAEEGGAMRQSAFEGRDRNNVRVADFQVLGRFTVGGAGVKLSSLLTDMWHLGQVQKARPLDGTEYPPDSRIEGILINFLSGAKEKDGKIAVGGAQVRLVMQNDDGQTMSGFPIAVSSQAEAATPVLARWWFDSEGTFIASVGGGAESLMGFEFVVPPGYEPIGIYVKGARRTLEGVKSVKFANASARDGAISTGFSGLGGGGAVAATNLDLTSATKAQVTRDPNSGRTNPPTGLDVRNTLGVTIQKGTHDQLEIDESQKNLIINGEVTMTLDAINNTRGIERALQINTLQSAADQTIIHINAAAGSQFSVLTPQFVNQDGNKPPTIYDANNLPYEPVGYMYRDETKFTLRFTPGRPISSMDELPKMSQSRPAQQLTLIYRLSKGVGIKYYGVGPKIVLEFEPPFIPGT